MIFVETRSAKIILAKYPSIEKLQHLRLTQPKREISELSEKARLLEQTHLLGHFGIDALIRALQSRGIVWPGMGEEAKATVDECTICQRYTIAKRGFHPYTYIMAKLPMNHVAMDLFEFPRSTAGVLSRTSCSRHLHTIHIPSSIKHKDMAKCNTNLLWNYGS